MKIFMKAMLVLIIVFFCGLLIVITELSRDKTINCDVAQFSPDMTPKQKEACRDLLNGKLILRKQNKQ